MKVDHDKVNKKNMVSIVKFKTWKVQYWKTGTLFEEKRTNKDH